MVQHSFQLPQTVIAHHKQCDILVDMYKNAEQLWQLFELQGLIERIQSIPQLGPIRVKPKYSLTRYDYMFVQLYLHQLVRTTPKIELRYTYGSELKAKDIPCEYQIALPEKFTIADAIQMMIILCNIGHFANTFTASRAILLYMHKHQNIQTQFLQQFAHKHIQDAARNMIEYYEYDNWHLLNTYLLLQSIPMDEALKQMSICLLQARLAPHTVPQNSRLAYVVELFELIRGLAYVTYDLKSTEMALSIDLYNTNEIQTLLYELLTQYNNTTQPRAIVTSAQKLLSDTVYNNPYNGLQYYIISQKICADIEKSCMDKDYMDLFHETCSPANRSYHMTNDFSQDNILKLTFNQKEFLVFKKLLTTLSHTEHIRFGYYTRAENTHTILVSIKDNAKEPIKVASKILSIVVSAMNNKSLLNDASIKMDDTRYLLVTKFFLKVIFSGYRLDINPTINQNCVFCARGNKAKEKKLQDLLHQSIGDKDQNHEVEFMRHILSKDDTRDTSVLVPASILIRKENNNEQVKEFDGLIIHPMRDRIVFLEAKNTKSSKQAAKKLKEKLHRFSLAPHAQIQTHHHDAYVETLISQL